MASKRELFKLQEVVKDILEWDEEARNSDDHLYAEVVRRVRPDVLDKPLRVVLHNFNQFDIPAYESVGRTRRKIQSECPWLIASDKVRQLRIDNEEIFRKYATECEVR